MAKDNKSERRLRHDNLILDSLVEGVCVIDSDETIGFSNRAAERMFGGSLTNGKSYEETFFRRSHGESEFCPIRFALREGEPSHVKTETFRRCDGGDFLVEYICVPLIEKGTIAGAVITFKDITESRDIERAIAEARDAAVENVRARAAFLANVSHEIRTPLNGIIGAANLLSETKLDEKQRNYLSMFKTSAELLLETVSEILDFSKIEAGKSNFETVEFDFRRLIADTAKVFESLASEKNIRFETLIDGKIPPRLRGGGHQLRQILNNLLSNALKFTEAGEITLEIKLEHADETRLTLYFSLSDTGIGIEKQNLNRLFQPFAQADDSTTRRFGGTGLGLAICREIVEKMNGQIGVESQLGKGSRFWLTAEFQPSAEISPDGKTNADSAEHLLHSFEKFALKALIVEDNQINRQITKEILQQIGITAEIAENGAEALEKCVSSDFDFILMDCRMPYMDGFEATEKILRRNSRMRQPKIIALTASATDDERERCFACGMIDFLTKPIDKNDLIKTLRKYFAVESAEKRLDLSENFVQHSLSEIISPAALEKLLEIERRGQKSFISEMINLYVEHTENGLTEIKAAFAAENYAVIEQKSHGLKGSSANIGAAEMAQLFERLEEKTRLRNQTEIRQTVSAISVKFINIKRILNRNL